MKKIDDYYFFFPIRNKRYAICLNNQRNDIVARL